MDDPEAILLVNQPGSDGFKVDSTPLFQVGPKQAPLQKLNNHVHDPDISTSDVSYTNGSNSNTVLSEWEHLIR